MSEKINDGGPAFPRSSQGPSGDLDMSFGMSLRDWFAGMAMQGLLVNAPDGNDGVEICKNAFLFADAMLKEKDQA